MANFSGSPNVLSGGFPLAAGGSTVVDGPGASTNNAIALWNGTGGNLLKDSNLTYSGSTLSVPASFGITGAGTTFDVATSSGQNARFSGTHLLLGGLTTDGTGVLQFPAATTSAGGITFGTDFNFYRKTTGQAFFSAAGPTSFGIEQTSGAADQKVWDFLASGANLQFRAVNDANSTATNWLTVARSGTTVSSIVFSTGAATGTTALTLDSSQNAQLAKKITSYNGITTAGQGVPVIVASANITGQTSNATITSYATPAADSDFEIACQLNCSAATSLSAPFQCTYTDVNNVAKTLTFAVQDVDGTGGTFLANGLMVAAAAKTFMTPVMRIRVKASTTITLKTGTGTYTSVTYSASGTITQLN